MKIALLMGSFNPVHNGHLGVARYVAERELADEIWFVVSPQNPFKDPSELAPFEDRLRMVKLALREQEDKRLKICDIERNLPQPSYTVDTIRVLRNKFSSYQFVILAGSDVAANLQSWKNSEDLQKMAPLLIYSRNEGEVSAELADAPRFGVDATWIRLEFARGDCGADVVKQADVLPESVFEYICHKRLYALDRTIERLDDLIAKAPEEARYYYERGRVHYRRNEFGKAANDFDATLRIDPGHTAAKHMKEMVESIFNFRNLDSYNP